jgi:small-conductance mechanosensitive channel
MNIFDLLTTIVTKFAMALPGIFTAIMVWIVGYIIAKTVSKVVEKTLAASGVDTLAEKLNDIDIVSQANLTIVPSQLLSKVMYYMMLLIFTLAATDILGMPAVSQIVKDIVDFVPNMIAAGIVLAVGLLFADMMKRAVKSSCDSLNIPSSNIISGFVFYFVFLTTAVSALGQAKIDTDFIKSNLTVILSAIAGAFALGYGLASKDMMASFLASFYTKDKFEIGDIVTVEGIKGEIVEMDNSSLIIKTETSHVVIPLNKLLHQSVEVHD